MVNTEQKRADPDPDLERISADLNLDLALPTKVDFYTHSNSCFTISKEPSCLSIAACKSLRLPAVVSSGTYMVDSESAKIGFFKFFNLLLS